MLVGHFTQCARSAPGWLPRHSTTALSSSPNQMRWLPQTAAAVALNHSVLSLAIQLRPFQRADLDTLYKIDQVCFVPGIAYSKAELRY